ncbi:MAG: LptF/LptG family permease [Elusimicrobium sp.]|jgi:LPS export ABC transporter permease LptF|nr:LptF/LptG family permease [Elusimicrobium sp.]
MRIKILSKYMLTNLLTFFAGALFVLVFIFFMMHFIKLFNLALTHGADVGWVFLTVLKLLPDIFSLCAPMAFQLAVLMSLGAMSENGEVLAMRAAGFSFGEITKPLFFFAGFLCVVIFIFSNWITPKNTRAFFDERNNMRGRINKILLEPKTFIEIGSWSLYADSIDRKTNHMTQVHLVSKDDKSALSSKINALSGDVNLTRDYLSLKLFDGQMQRVPADNPSQIIAANFKQYRVTFPLVVKSQRDSRVEEFTTPQLLSKIYSGNMETAARAEYKTEAATRTVMALSPFILVLLSCPLVFSLNKKAGKAWGMLWSIIIIFSFYMLLMAGVSIGKKYEIFAFFAPFLPVAGGLLAANYLWKTRLKR